MPAVAWFAAKATILWQVKGCRLREGHAPHAPWWWSNRARQPAGCVVAQFIRRGRIIWREGGADRELGPGSLLLFAFGEDTAYGRPPDRPDWPGHGDHLQMDHVTLGGAGLREHWDWLRARRGSTVVLAERSPCLAALRRLCAGERIAAGTRAVVPVAQFVASLAEAIEDAAGTARQPVERAVEAILADPFTEHNLKAIAQRCGCSREHLSRVFQERVGAPPVAWMRERRLARAIDLLRETLLPLKAVAAQCGAGSVHRLARWTRAAHGCSPRELAARLKHPDRIAPDRKVEQEKAEQEKPEQKKGSRGGSWRVNLGEPF